MVTIATVILGDGRRAAVMVSVFLVAFFSHDVAGPFYRIMWVIAIVGIGASAFWRGRFNAANTFLNAALTVAVISSAVTLWATAPDTGVTVRHPLVALESSRRPLSRPDIWYIVLDGYTRGDILRTVHGHESELEPWLENQGFYVAAAANSNYSLTPFSFAATLNLTYLQELLEIRNPASGTYLPVKRLIERSRATRSLTAFGYRIVTYPSDYSLTWLNGKQETRSPLISLNELEYQLIDNTALPSFFFKLGLPRGLASHVVRRHHINWVLDDLERGDRWDTPVFVYAHIVLPHPPFVFRDDGSYRKTSVRTLQDGVKLAGRLQAAGESYTDGYVDQVKYLEYRLQRVIRAILATSKGNAVVLLQGDHGSRSQPLESSVGIQEQMAILSAYYFPDRDFSALRPTITPVNSFRVVFRKFLAVDVDQLPDRSYYSMSDLHYHFMDVTDRIAITRF
jgi:hypothetical protein